MSTSSASQEGHAGTRTSPRTERTPSSSSRDTIRPTATASSSAASGRAHWATTEDKPQRRQLASPGSLVDELDDDDSSSETGGTGGDGDGDSDTEDAAHRQRHGSSSVSSNALGVGTSKQELVYVLEVVQQPQRARACGFGDKDRRPLSPPPIIQLRVLDKAGNAVAPHLVDFHRLILMVDLWNGDQTQQRSIVMHPGARPDPQSMYSQSSRPPSQPPQSTLSRTPLRAAALAAGYGRRSRDWESYSSPPHGGPYRVSTGRPPILGWPPPPTHAEAQPWGAAGSGSEYGHPSLEWHEDPRVASSSRTAISHSDSRSGAWSTSADSRVWTPEMHQSEFPPDRPSPSYSPAYPPSSLHGEGGWSKDSSYTSMGGHGREWSHHPGSYEDWERMHPPPGRPWTSSGDSHRTRSHTGPLYTHAPSPISQQSALPLTTSPPPLYPEAQPERVSTTSHYSRVLVGSLGAVCQRLKGLDGQTGLFFFTHDLGIRTEGTFSLRFTLVDVSAFMGSAVSSEQSVPTLARVSSDTFTVYSAKRFPGVLPTTELTQCFADQSVRLPTRQKRGHATAASGSKRKK